MAKYRSEDEASIVENPAVGDNGEVIVAAAGTEPDMPPTTPVEPIAPVDSTRAPESDPTVPEQRFRFSSEGEDTEAPAAPIDAPAEAPDADAAPADAPAVAPAAPVGPEVAPEAAPMEAPVADVPAAAPMAEPQPEVEVAPAAPVEGEVPAAAPVAPEVAASPEVGAVEPAAAVPEEALVDNEPAQCGGKSRSGKSGKKGFKQEDGEEMSVVATEEPKMPVDTETSECPETGDTCVDKDVREPINPVIKQEDEIVAEAEAGEVPGDKAGGTEPVEAETKDNLIDITPEEAEAQNEIAEATQCMRMEGESETEGGAVDEGDGDGGESGDQSVKVNVAVEGPDTDAHEGEDAAPLIADAEPVACGGKKLFKSEDGVCDGACPAPIETVADVNKAPVDAPVNPDVADDVVPVPDPNAGNPDPDQCFRSFMQEGGGFF